MEKEIKQIAGASINEFVSELVANINDGWKIDDVAGVTHFWPSTFCANVYKETEDTQAQDVEDKQEPRQRQQRKTKP